MRDIELHLIFIIQITKSIYPMRVGLKNLNLDMRLFCQYLFQLLKNRRSSAIVLRNNDR